MKRIALAVLILLPLVAAGAIKSEPIPDLRPPRAELPPLPAEKSRLPWVLGAAGAAVVALALLWPRRRPALPPVSAFDLARAAIVGLRADPSLATPLSVSAMVRRYAASAFALPGTGVTAEEVASGLAARRNCPTELASQVWQFLAECDVAKFSPGASNAASAELVERAEKLIEALENARVTAERTL